MGGPSFNPPDEMCGFCLGYLSDKPFNDLRKGANWRVTTCSHAQFQARLSRPLHPLATREDLFGPLFVRLDAMHVLDNKGVVCLVGGGVFHILMQDLRLGANQDQRLSFLNGRMASFLAGKKSKMPPFRLSNLILKGWGNLHGQTVKSANSRTLAPWFAELAEEFLGDSPEHKSIKKLTATLRDIYALIYSAGFFLSDGEKTRLRDLTIRFGTHYQFASVCASNNNQLRFPITPKLHLMQHLPEQSDLINCRFTQNYLEEGMMGRLQQVWKGILHGPNVEIAQRKVLTRCVLVVQLKFSFSSFT